MIEFGTHIHKREKNYEMRIVILCKVNKDIDAMERLNTLHMKLDKAIPTSYRPKYNRMTKEMTVSIRCAQLNEAHSMAREISEYLKAAIRAVNREYRAKEYKLGDSSS